MMTPEQKQIAKKFIELLKAEIEGKQIEYVDENGIVSLAFNDRFVPSYEYLSHCRIKQELEVLYEIFTLRINENLDDEELRTTYVVTSNKDYVTKRLQELKEEYVDDPDVQVLVNIYELKNTLEEI